MMMTGGVDVERGEYVNQHKRTTSSKSCSIEHTFLGDDRDESRASASGVKRKQRYTSNMSTDAFEEKMRAGKSNILVAVRARPLSTREKDSGALSVLRVLDEKVVCLLDHERETRRGFLGHGRSREKRYAFDHAFDEDCSQRHVYNNTTKFLIEGVTQGFNASVFAYGATGAGKTFTMTGTREEPGIMLLALEDLFDRVRMMSADNVITVTLSFLEVYNENLRDLFKPSSKYLSLREDPLKGIRVAGVTELIAQSATEVMQLLSIGNENRTTEPTEANQTSSRSHAILQVMVEQKNRTSARVEMLNVSKLSLIDLAGSERASLTKNTGIRMIEGANINRSLLALGNCINALGARSNFVPFRDSKLTRMLKDSLGGNTRTVMITNVSKADLSFEDTHNTLKYANRAKNIKTTVKRNVLEVSHHMERYTEIINDLRTEVSELKRQARADRERQESREDVSSSLQREHWFSAGDMTTWNETRRKAIAIFSERQNLLERFSALQVDNITNSQQLRKAQLLARSCDSPSVKNNHEQRVSSLEKRALARQQQEAELRKLGEKVLMQEKRLRDDVGMAGVNASQPVSQILELELERHKLKVKNLHLEKFGSLQEHSLKAGCNQIKDLEEQIRLRDQLILEQTSIIEKTGPVNDVSSMASSCRKQIFAIEDIMSCSPTPSISSIEMSVFLPPLNNAKLKPMSSSISLPSLTSSDSSKITEDNENEFSGNASAFSHSSSIYHSDSSRSSSEIQTSKTALSSRQPLSRSTSSLPQLLTGSAPTSIASSPISLSPTRSMKQHGLKLKPLSNQQMCSSSHESMIRLRSQRSKAGISLSSKSQSSLSTYSDPVSTIANRRSKHPSQRSSLSTPILSVPGSSFNTSMTSSSFFSLTAEQRRARMRQIHRSGNSSNARKGDKIRSHFRTMFPLEDIGVNSAESTSCRNHYPG